jgi:hypothetical protein
VSAAKRARDAKRAQPRTEPYARITAAHLLALACCLSPDGVRLVLLLHANWTVDPARPGSEHGRTVLPYAVALRNGFKSRKAIKRAFDELTAAGVIVLDRPGTSPQRAGCARGAAAVWRLPNREGGDAGVKLPLPASVKVPSGVVRWNAGQMRADSRDLSSAALKVLAMLIAFRPRDGRGALVLPKPMVLSARRFAQLLQMPASRCAVAVNELLAKRRITEAAPAKGRAPRSLEVASCYQRHDRVRTVEKQKPGSIGGHNAASSVPWLDTKRAASSIGTEDRAAEAV